MSAYATIEESEAPFKVWFVHQRGCAARRRGGNIAGRGHKGNLLAELILGSLASAGS